MDYPVVHWVVGVIHESLLLTVHHSSRVKTVTPTSTLRPSDLIAPNASPNQKVFQNSEAESDLPPPPYPQLYLDSRQLTLCLADDLPQSQACFAVGFDRTGGSVLASQLARDGVPLHKARPVASHKG